MREFEFDRDDAILAAEDSWRRLFARVAPNIRKDIIGWLGISPKNTQYEVELESGTRAWRDYLTGASLVLNLTPDLPSKWIKSDREALQADAMTASDDASCIHAALMFLIWSRSDERTSAEAGRPSGEEPNKRATG
jgi:hypothetical protein